jgi:predicted amidohydrolase YtcJ
MTARRVIAGGPIVTMDPGRPEASWVLVEGERIAGVGRPGEPVPAGAGPFLDLAGRTLLPGFVDAHTHLMHWGFRFLRPELGEATGRDEVLSRVREAHGRLAPGRPLIGEGWDESGWADRAFPTRDDLDAIDRTRPIVLRRICGHMSVANSAALALIPPSPEVDPSSGILVEEASMGIARVFPPGDAEFDEALAAAERSYFSMGVTMVHDMTLPAHLRAFARAEALGTMRLAVAAILTREHLDLLCDSGLGAGWRRGRVRVRGVKFFSDGSLGARTAALRSDYADRPGETGMLLLEEDALTRDIARAEGAGVPLCIHAIGDRAVDMVLGAFEAGLGGRPSRLGHRIEHLEMVDAAGLDLMARLGIEASMQPNFVGNWGLAGGLYEQRLGPARTALMNPMRSVLDAGVRLVLGSDGMPADVLRGLADAVGAPHAPQRLSVGEALAGATREAALSGGFDDRGVLREGAVADLVVLAGCPGSAESGESAARQLRTARVERVMAAGRTVFELLEPNPANASGVQG